MTPINTSEESNEKEVSSNLLDNQEKQRTIFQLGQFFRIADVKRVFSKGVSTNWSYKLYTTTEVIHDTIPSFRLNFLPEKYNQNFLLPTQLSLDENNQVMKEINLFQ